MGIDRGEEGGGRANLYSSAVLPSVVLFYHHRRRFSRSLPSPPFNSHSYVNAMPAVITWPGRCVDFIESKLGVVGEMHCGFC